MFRNRTSVRKICHDTKEITQQKYLNTFDKIKIIHHNSVQMTRLQMANIEFYVRDIVACMNIEEIAFSLRRNNNSIKSIRKKISSK
jgi:hypothetical protein